MKFLKNRKQIKQLPPPSYFLQTTDDKLNERLQELDDLINVKQVECDALAPTDKHKKAALEYLLNLTNAKKELLKRKMALYEQSHGMPASADVSTQILNFPIHTKVVGVTFDDHQQNIAQSKAGDTLTIKHEPFEQFTESTSVYNARTGKLLGRINKELAHELVSKFGNGFTLNGEITQITGGTNDRPTFGCNIEIQL